MSCSLRGVKIILASASPRRKDLLKGLGWEFETVPADVPEPRVEGETPSEMVERLSLLKGRSVASRFPEALVVASDTVVAQDGQIFTKPADAADALRMLTALSGAVHHVHSGIALFWRGCEMCRSEITAVHFRALDEEYLKGYIATGEPFGKAGAYAIQGLGSLMVEGIEGDYSNVVGLPLCLLGKMMGSLGFSLNRQWGVEG